jgi:four helix bundle protein
MKNFKTYQLAKELYQACNKQPLKGEIRDQLHRASLSVVLNISEGSAKPSLKERRRYYHIALGSLRETQTIIDLENLPLIESADRLGAHLYKLIQSLGA